MADSEVSALVEVAEAVLDEPALHRLRSALADLSRRPASERYQRLTEELDRLAHSAGAGPFVSCDSVLLTRMDAAVEVLRTAGLEVEPCPDTPEQLLGRAIRWQRYARRPIPAPLRACAVDVARGSLRLWSVAGGRPDGLTPAVVARRQLQLARVQLGARARSITSHLRAQLGREAAALALGGIPDFGDRLRAEAIRAASEMDEAVSRRIAELGLPAEDAGPWRVEDCVPQRRSRRLENRLTMVVGAGFGAGVAVTAARLAAGLRPHWTVAAAVVSGLLGLGLMCWVVAVRRLLVERVAAEQRVVETAANLRTAFQERVITRMISAESAGSAGFGREFAGDSRVPGPIRGDPPN